MKMRRSLMIEKPESVRPARQKNGHITASRTKAVSITAKYDPIGAINSKQEVMERHSRLSLEYRAHQLTSLGIPIFGELKGAPDGPGDM